ncbi:MAG: RNA chaperone Hfq [Roseburia sp.]|nr:RNA chaperone Hfq [Roseburia sp.]
MARYLLTHSLLSSWLYAMKDNPYEDATSERNAYDEFLRVLRKEPTETTEAMMNGIRFEGTVTAITRGAADTNDPWYGAASKIAAIVGGGPLQVKASKEISVNGMTILLYGRLDSLKAGVIRDIKFSKGYDRGKYITSTQHPTYFEIVPEAIAFEYLVSNGTEVWTERYERADTPSIIPIISDFLSWLREVGLMQVYQMHWEAK